MQCFQAEQRSGDDAERRAPEIRRLSLARSTSARSSFTGSFVEGSQGFSEVTQKYEVSYDPREAHRDSVFIVES